MRIFIMKKSTLIKAAVFVLLIIGAVIYTQFFMGDVSGVFSSKADEQMPVCSIKTDVKQIALTIDTAFGNDKTQQILDILDQYNVKATFFVVGVWAQENPEMLKKIIADGQEVQNHSMKHERYPDLQVSEVLADAQAAQSYLNEETGKNANIIRLPFGAFDDKTLQVLQSSGFTPVKWSVDAEDWKTDDVKQIYNNVISNVKGGDIIMLQNNTAGAEGALKDIIAQLLDKGYEFKTISQILPQGTLQVDSQGRASVIQK
ncbi:MAG: polysaccharide deacetylase family protein [Eubacteriales bacterium]